MNIFSDGTKFRVGRERIFPGNRKVVCSHSHDTLVSTAHNRTQRTSTMTHHANTRGSSRLPWCVKSSLSSPTSCLARCRACHNTLQHDLSPASHIFRPSYPSLSGPVSAHSRLDYETLRDPWRSGGFTKSASPHNISTTSCRLTSLTMHLLKHEASAVIW